MLRCGVILSDTPDIFCGVSLESSSSIDSCCDCSSLGNCDLKFIPVYGTHIVGRTTCSHWGKLVSLHFRREDFCYSCSHGEKITSEACCSYSHKLEVIFCCRRN